MQYDLAFGRDEEGRAVVTGRVRTRLRLTCQRCLGEVELALDVPLRVALLRVGQADDTLPDDLDPVTIDDGSFRPLDLVEDEILLAIPPVARHAPGGCAPPVDPAAAVEPDTRAGAGEERPNPFAALSAVRRGNPG